MVTHQSKRVLRNSLADSEPETSLLDFEDSLLVKVWTPHDFIIKHILC